MAGDAGEQLLRVVYVLAVQNSGSTALDALLGNAPGTRSLGEFAGFHRIANGEACDCGRETSWCGPCLAVVTTLESTADGGEAWTRPFESVMGGGRLRWALAPSRARRRYAERASAALVAAADATGAQVLVDSSKNVARVAALLSLRRHDIRVLHLVRAPHGYLRSRRRRADRVGRQRAPALILHWLVKNLLAATLIRWRAGRGRYLRVNMADLVERPGTVLERIGTFAGLDLAGVAERATSSGVAREHLYEPKRAVDYAIVRLDPARLSDRDPADRA